MNKESELYKALEKIIRKSVNIDDLTEEERETLFSQKLKEIVKKWNNSKSVDIKNLSEEEKDEAFIGWGMGDEVLYKLLKNFNRNNIETFGSHVGPGGYIDFNPNRNNEKLRQLLNVIKDTRAVLHLSFGGNIIGMDKIDSTNLSLGTGYGTSKEDLYEVFGRINDILEGKEKIPEDNNIAYILDLQEFLSDKESNLGFHFNHDLDDRYSIDVGLFPNKYEDRLNELLKTVGISKYDEENFKGSERCEWRIEFDSYDDFTKKIKELTETFIQNYDIPPINDLFVGNDSNRARTLNRVLGKTEEGKIKFQKWFDSKIEQEDKESKLRDEMKEKFKFETTKEGRKKYYEWEKKYKEEHREEIEQRKREELEELAKLQEEVDRILAEEEKSKVQKSVEESEKEETSTKKGKIADSVEKMSKENITKTGDTPPPSNIGQSIEFESRSVDTYNPIIESVKKNPEDVKKEESRIIKSVEELREEVEQEKENTVDLDRTEEVKISGIKKMREEREINKNQGVQYGN